MAGIGKWKLPQPTDWRNGTEYAVLPRVGKSPKPPFGYDFSEDGEWLIPNPELLDVFHQAIKHTKKYSLADVAKWVYGRTGIKISVQTLRNRIINKRSTEKRANVYKRWASYAEDALQKAEVLEAQRADGKRAKVPKVRHPTPYQGFPSDTE